MNRLKLRYSSTIIQIKIEEHCNLLMRSALNLNLENECAERHIFDKKIHMKFSG